MRYKCLTQLACRVGLAVPEADRPTYPRKSTHMNTSPDAAHGRSDFQGHPIEVADTSLSFRHLVIPESAPTGAQLAAAAGFMPPAGHVSVMHMLLHGELENIRLDEHVDLEGSTRKFVVVQEEPGFEFTIDSVRFDWPFRLISGGQLRKLAQVPAEREIYLALPDGVERVIERHELVDLSAPHCAAFKTREHTWKLNVQGVLLVLHEPTIVVRQAIKDAGFDPSKNWIIILRVHEQPKREVGLDYVIDLRTPGIDKLRLTPREVNNGEAVARPRREFALLEVDERFLDASGLWWETLIDEKRRWLLLHDYPVPLGFTAARTLLALEVPLTYPNAQIDMFYTRPPLALKTGRAIDRTQVSALIQKLPFNGWSRHRGQLSPWNPESDNVATHLALVESAMMKEVGE